MFKAVLIVTALITVSAFGIGRMKFPPQESLQSASEERMTAKQKEHSKLYERYRTGKKLSDLAAKAAGEVETRTSGNVEVSTYLPSGIQYGDPEPQPAYPNNFLRGIACDADAIVVGMLKNPSSHLTENGEFIFTD